MMDWQGVTNFEKSEGNSFDRILLPGRAGGLAAVRHDGEGSPPAALEALRHRERAEKDYHEVARRNKEGGGDGRCGIGSPFWR